jgi:choline dehydrogenase
MVHAIRDAAKARFDVVVVGAGSAGCVVAARLSEDSRRQVLLLDAGPDYGADIAAWPTDLVNAHTLVQSHDWGFVSEPGESTNRLPLLRGKVFGGSSATNNVIALRGQPADYDGWAQAGNEGWSFEDVLPFFLKLERDLDFDDDWHGRLGPITVRRAAHEAICPLQRAFLEAALAQGHPWVEDHNAPGATGVGRLPENVDAGVRQSTAFTYLLAARRRPNLTTCANVLVDRIEFDRDRAVGVRLVDPAQTILADQVVLAAGVYGTPAILLRSGVGPSPHLRELGLWVTCELGGVGAHLQDHPLLWLQFGTTAKPQSAGQPIRQMLLTTSSAESSRADLQIFPSGPTASEDGSSVQLLAGVMRPDSRGSLSLASLDPRVPPRIDLRLLSDPADLTRLVAALRHARAIAASAPLAGNLTDEQWPGARVQSEEELARAIREPASSVRFSSYQHGVGTCRMGPGTDRMAVVSARGVVHGINGVRVVDASIMPTIPAANTNLPTIMVAERLAATWV